MIAQHLRRCRRTVEVSCIALDMFDIQVACDAVTREGTGCGGMRRDASYQSSVIEEESNMPGRHYHKAKAQTGQAPITTSFIIEIIRCLYMHVHALEV